MERHPWTTSPLFYHWTTEPYQHNQFSEKLPQFYTWNLLVINIIISKPSPNYSLPCLIYFLEFYLDVFKYLHESFSIFSCNIFFFFLMAIKMCIHIGQWIIFCMLPVILITCLSVFYHFKGFYVRSGTSQEILISDWLLVCSVLTCLITNKRIQTGTSHVFS